MDSCSDKIFVDKIERLFIMNTYPMDDVWTKKMEEPNDLFGNYSDRTTQTGHEPSGIRKQQRSNADILITLRGPHRDFQAFGDTDGSLSRMEIQTTKGSNGLITDGKLTTPGLKLVVDKLQLLDDNLRQIEEVVEEHMELIHQGPKDFDSKSRGNFLASETGDGKYSQETLVEKNDQINHSKSEKLQDSCEPDRETEKPLCIATAHHQLAMTDKELEQQTIDSTKELDNRLDVDTISQELLIKCEENETLINVDVKQRKKCEIMQLVEKIEKLDLKDIQEVHSETICEKDDVAVGTINNNENDNIMGYGIRYSNGTWKSPINYLASKFSGVETTTDTVQNVLAATACVLVLMCIIDNLAEH